MTKRAKQSLGLGQRLLKIFGFERNFDAIVLEISESLRYLRVLQPITGPEPAHIMVHIEGTTNKLFSLGARESQKDYIAQYVTEAELWVENSIPSKAKWVLHILSDKLLDGEPIRIRVLARADYSARKFKVEETELISDLCEDPLLAYKFRFATLEA